MNYDELIKNWHTKALDEDYFSKFVFEYLAFIAFLRKKKFKDASYDRCAIQRLKQDETVRHDYLGKFERIPELRRAWQSIYDELVRTPLGNVSGNSDDIEEIKWWNCSADCLARCAGRDQRRKGILHDLHDWENMVEFWYSIRNNLFHGGKDPQDERDQILVENGYKTLRPLIDIFLTND